MPQSETNSNDGPLSLKEVVSPSFEFVEIEPECCLCYDREQPIVSDKFGIWICITDYQGDIPDDHMFLGPCRKHITCKACMVALLSNNDPPFISPNHIRVPCLSAGEICMNELGQQSYFSDSEIRKLLTPDLYSNYLNEVERYSVPGYELIACPHCLSKVPVELNDPALANYGRAVIRCTQNSQCRWYFCYHCRGTNVSFRNTNAIFCRTCTSYDNERHPKSLNHYFYKPNRNINDRASPILWRNEELTLELVINQLKEIVEVRQNDWMEHGTAANSVHALRCFKCLQGFIKTQDCNSMTHCNIQHCYVCNFSMNEAGQMIPWQHWNTCPRFDVSEQWKRYDCQVLCTPGICSGQKQGECKKPSHRAALRKLHTKRRWIQITSAYKSLLPEMQVAVKDFLSKNPKGCAQIKKAIDNL